MEYYKFKWHNNDSDWCDGGKYFHNEIGFYLAPASHAIFKVMEQSMSFLSYNCDSYELHDAITTAQDSKELITEEEYKVLTKFFGEGYVVSGSVNGGGCKEHKCTLDDLIKQIEGVVNDMKSNILANGKEIALSSDSDNSNDNLI